MCAREQTSNRPARTKDVLPIGDAVHADLQENMNAMSGMGGAMMGGNKRMSGGDSHPLLMLRSRPDD